MSVLVSNMFEADMTKFEFVFSSSAFIKTLLYFGVMYILVMIFNTFSVNKCKLIDLLSFSKKSEQIKNEKSMALRFCICCGSLYAGVCILSGKWRFRKHADGNRYFYSHYPWLCFDIFNFLVYVWLYFKNCNGAKKGSTTKD